MATQSNGLSNPNNSTTDPRIIWEDGTWAIIEAKDWPPGIGRSKTRDTVPDAIAATWEAGLGNIAIGPQSIRASKLVKVKLGDFLNVPPPSLSPGPLGGLSPKAFQDPATPVAPPSPMMPKPWKGKDIPEYPHVCPNCGGRTVHMPSGHIHEMTDPKHSRGDGSCPQKAAPPIAPPAQRVRRARP